MRKMMPGALLLSFIWLTPCLCQAGADELSVTLFNRGIQHYSHQDYISAADYLGQVCDMSPDNHQARYYLIYSLLAQKQNAKALEHAKILCRKNPGNKQYAALRDQIARAEPANAASKQGAKSAIPKEVILGDEAGFATSPRPAAPASAAIKIPPKPQTDLDAAIEAIGNDQFAEAARLLDAVLEKDPKNQPALHYRGVTELNQQRLSEAQAWFEKALAAKPDSCETLFMLGEIMLKAGKVKESEGMFAKALKIRPDDILTLLRLAEAKLRQGNGKEAFELYSRVRKLDPSIVEARLSSAEELMDQGKLDEAISTVNGVLEADWSNLVARGLKGRILFAQELYEDAATEFKWALNSQSDNMYMKVWLAKALMRDSQRDESLELASQILTTDPENYDAHLLRAEGLIMGAVLKPYAGEKGTYNGIAEAGAYIDQTEKKRKSPEIARLRAKLAEKNGDFGKMSSYYDQYIKSDPKNTNSYFECADSFKKMKKIDEAAKVLQQLISVFPDTAVSTRAKSKIDEMKGITGDRH